MKLLALLLRPFALVIGWVLFIVWNLWQLYCQKRDNKPPKP